MEGRDRDIMEMTDDEKAEVFFKVMATRRGRVDMAHAMCRPIGARRHPCEGCGHACSPNKCEGIVHVVDGSKEFRFNVGCWHPDGTLAVGDERETDG